MADRVVELTDDEFRLVCMAVADSKTDFERYAAQAPTDEDSMVDNAEVVAFADLQAKFPDPDDEGMIRLKDDDGA